MEKEDEMDDALCLTRFDLGNAFDRLLIHNNFLTKEEVEQFTSTDRLQKEYLIKNMPVIKIS